MKKNIRIIASLLIVATLIIQTFITKKYFSNEEIITQSFGMLGRAATCLLISYIIYIFCKKKQGIQLIWFSIFFFAATMGNIQTQIHRQSTYPINRVKKELSSSVKEFIEEIEFHPKQIESNNNSSNDIEEDLNTCINFVKNQMTTQKNNILDFKKVFEKEHIENILSVETLGNHDKIHETRNKLQRVNQLINFSENEFKKRQKETDLLVNKLELKNNELKKGALKGYNERKQTLNILNKTLYKTFRANILETDTLLKFLYDHEDSYYVENGILMFFEDRNLSKYNTHIQKINRLAKEVSNIQNKIMKPYISLIQNS